MCYSSQDAQLKDLSEQIKSLQSFIQKNIDKFNKKIISKDNKLMEMSEIIELLQSRSEQYARESSELDDKIRLNELKINELAENIPLKLEDLCEKIVSLELNLQQIDENFSKFNKKNSVKQQQLLKLSEANSQAITELHEKSTLIDNQLNTVTDLKKRMALHNDELVNIFERMSNLQLRIQDAQDQNINLNKKLYAMYGVNAIFLIISTMLIIKGIK